MNKTQINLRLSHKDTEFLKKYGTGQTEQIEQALARLRILEENQEHLKTEQDQKKQDQLDFLREKERIKTEALKLRQQLRPARAMHAQVDWGEGYAGDSDSKYEDGWGDNF